MLCLQNTLDKTSSVYIYIHIHVFFLISCTWRSPACWMSFIKVIAIYLVLTGRVSEISENNLSWML